MRTRTACACERASERAQRRTRLCSSCTCRKRHFPRGSAPPLLRARGSWPSGAASTCNTSTRLTATQRSIAAANSEREGCAACATELAAPTQWHRHVRTHAHKCMHPRTQACGHAFAHANAGRLTPICREKARYRNESSRSTAAACPFEAA